jgi:uracil phosphoribosyltransferase
MAQSPHLVVVQHPVVQHKLTLLRSRETGKKLFKELMDELATLMAYEVTRDFPLEEVEIHTPLERATGWKVAGSKVVVVPILRAGLGMVDGFLRVIPQAGVGHIGLYRNEETMEPVEYYFKTPEPANRAFILLDPMLATGGSAAAAADFLKRIGVQSIRLVSLVAAPEGVSRMREAHPEIRIYTAALDRGLNEVKYIVPGLGDAGDRLFGTV